MDVDRLSDSIDRLTAKLESVQSTAIRHDIILQQQVHMIEVANTQLATLMQHVHSVTFVGKALGWIMGSSVTLGIIYRLLGDLLSKS